MDDQHHHQQHSYQPDPVYHQGHGYQQSFQPPSGVITSERPSGTSPTSSPISSHNHISHQSGPFQAGIGHSAIGSQDGSLEPSELPIPQDEEPLYVNAKQYHRILKRRAARARLEELNRLAKIRKPYLHESRHKHAMRRPRGPGGRFLTSQEIASMQSQDQDQTNNQLGEDINLGINQQSSEQDQAFIDYQIQLQRYRQQQGGHSQDQNQQQQLNALYDQEDVVKSEPLPDSSVNNPAKNVITLGNRPNNQVFNA
ncbi:Transcriptional activator [Entomortierella beljakovae]|nr:Transcriptional activator [Entomortierella beljakovae]